MTWKVQKISKSGAGVKACEEIPLLLNRYSIQYISIIWIIVYQLLRHVRNKPNFNRAWKRNLIPHPITCKHWQLSMCNHLHINCKEKKKDLAFIIYVIFDSTGIPADINKGRQSSILGGLGRQEMWSNCLCLSLSLPQMKTKELYSFMHTKMK